MGKKGSPDWGQSLARAVAAATPDLGEAAARLGSPSTHYRTGAVLFQDGFEFGSAPWVTEPYGTGSKAELMGDWSMRGRFSMRLTAGSDGGRQTQVHKTIFPPALTKVGLECAFSFEDAGGYMDLLIRYRDGTRQLNWEVSFDPSGGSVDYYHGVNGWTELQSMSYQVSSPAVFYQAKLVVDLENEVYARLHLGRHTWDLAGAPAYITSETTAERLTFAAIMYSESNGVNRRGRVDELIITADEP